MSSNQENDNESNYVSFQPKRSYRGGIRCAHTGEVFHSSTDIHTSGHYSHNLGLWFSSSFNYNEYCFNKQIHAYADPAFRNQMASNFNKDVRMYKSKVPDNVTNTEEKNVLEENIVEK